MSEAPKLQWSKASQFAAGLNSELTVIIAGAAAALERIPLSDLETRRLLLEIQGAGVEAAMLAVSTQAPHGNGAGKT